MENGARTFGLSSSPSYLFLRPEINLRSLQVFGESRNKRTDRKKPKQITTSPTSAHHPNKKYQPFYPRGSFDKRSWNHVRNPKKDSKVSPSRRDDRLSLSALLQTDLTSFQYVQKQET